TALADAYLDWGDGRAARRVRKRLATLQPHDLGVRLLLFNAALEARDGDALQRLVRELRELEGEEGPLWRYGEAARLTELAGHSDRETAAKARGLLAEVSRIRPGWWATSFLEGRIEEEAGNLEGAAEKYARAFEQGGRGFDFATRLVRLLNQERRYSEAREIV